MRNLIPKIELRRVSGAVVAGTGDTLTFTEVDTRGYHGATIVVVLGAVATLNAKLSDTSAAYGAGTIDTAVLPAAAPFVTTGGSNKFLVLEIHRPRRRYLRAQLTRATANIAIESVMVILHEAEHVPTSGAELAAAYTILNNPIPSAV